MRLTKVYPVSSFKALTDEEPGRFEAIVSVFGSVDLQGDRTMPGAFKNTLAKWRKSGDPLPIIWSHDWLNPEAHIGWADPNDVQEISTPIGKGGTGGLLVRGQIDVQKPFAGQVFDLLKDRRVKSWSWSYDVVREKTADDGANELLEVDLWEAGPCLLGAHPDTLTISAKSAIERELDQAWQDAKAMERFHRLIADWDAYDPEVAAMLTKTYVSGTSAGPAKRYHVEPRVPDYEGSYSLEQSDVFACIENASGKIVDTHKTESEARAHVELLAKGTPGMTEADIRKALDLGLPKTQEETEVVPVEIEIDGQKFEVDPSALLLVSDEDPESGQKSETDAAIDELEAALKTAGKPWHIEERDGQFCVIKDTDASVEKCHDTREDALAHMRALYANEPKSEEPEEQKVGDLFWSADENGLLEEQKITEIFDDGTMTSEKTGLKWDGDAAMATAHSAADFRKIAFERANDSDPDTAAHWALPHHTSPSAGPDKGGVSAAWGALHGSRGGKPALKNPSAAESHLSGHRSSLGLGDDDEKTDEPEKILVSASTSTSSFGINYSTSEIGGVTTWTISVPDGEKVGRVVGAKAAAALKARLAEAVDAFVKEVNGQADEPDPKTVDEPKDDPDADIKARLNALFEGDN